MLYFHRFKIVVQRYKKKLISPNNSGVFFYHFFLWSRWPTTLNNCSPAITEEPSRCVVTTFLKSYTIAFNYLNINLLH